MILNNAVNAGGFIYCMASFTPWEFNEYHNIGDGHYHQWCYIINGWGKSELKDLDGNVLRTVEEKTRPNDLIDLTPAKDLLHCTTVFDSPLSMILFNPIPDTRNIQVEIVKNGTKTITATDVRTTAVCITGPVTINDKQLKSLQHAKIFPGKTAEVTVPDHSILALVTEVK